jgi:hypothetical protein
MADGDSSNASGSVIGDFGLRYGFGSQTPLTMTYGSWTAQAAQLGYGAGAVVNDATGLSQIAVISYYAMREAQGVIQISPELGIVSGTTAAGLIGEWGGIAARGAAGAGAVLDGAASAVSIYRETGDVPTAVVGGALSSARSGAVAYASIGAGEATAAALAPTVFIPVVGPFIPPVGGLAAAGLTYFGLNHYLPEVTASQAASFLEFMRTSESNYIVSMGWLPSFNDRWGAPDISGWSSPNILNYGAGQNYQSYPQQMTFDDRWASVAPTVGDGAGIGTGRIFSEVGSLPQLLLLRSKARSIKLATGTASAQVGLVI